jgi:predicted XRE-type DNA-binding protein
METKMSLRELRGRLRERDISQWQFSQATGVPQSTLSGVLRGQIPLDNERRAGLVRGILRLGLAAPLTPAPDEDVIEIPVAVGGGETSE